MKSSEDDSIADMIVNGKICQQCTIPLAFEYGVPVSCSECGGIAKGDGSWIATREAWWRSMTKTAGAISAMIADLSSSELKSVVGWCNYILKTKPDWYRKKISERKLD